MFGEAGRTPTGAKVLQPTVKATVLLPSKHSPEPCWALLGTAQLGAVAAAWKGSPGGVLGKSALAMNGIFLLHKQTRTRVGRELF